MENTCALVHVPEDITRDILRRLPVESLLRCRCVCKSWLNLIQSVRFVESYTNDAANRRTRSIFLKRLWKYSWEKVEEEEDPDLTKMMLCEIMHINKIYKIQGHCNGVICLSLNDGNISLWNPAMRQYRVLPPPSRGINRHSLNLIDVNRVGIGYDSTNRDYKVVDVPCRTDGTSNCEMYSLKSNSWKSIQCEHLQFIDHNLFSISNCGCSFKGRLHWIVSCRPRHGGIKMFLIVFDFTEEKFLEFDIPEFVHKKHITKYSLDLGVFKGRLSWLLKDSGEYEIWSSEDDSCTPESWTRAWRFSPEELQLKNGLQAQTIRLTEDENMVIKADYRCCNTKEFVFLYDFRMNGLKLRKTLEDKQCVWFPITKYVETLVSVMPKTRRRCRNLPATRTTRKRRKSSLCAMT